MSVVKPSDLPLLTAQDVADTLLPLPARSIRTLAREGRLPSVQIGRRVLFSRAAIEEAVRESMESGRPL